MLSHCRAVLSILILLFAATSGLGSTEDLQLSPEELFSEISVLITSGQAEAALALAEKHAVPVPEREVLDEQYGTFLLNMGWIELTLGQHEKALAHLEKSRRFWPDSFWLPVYLTQACHALSRFECVWAEYSRIPDWYLKQQNGIALIAAESAQKSGRPERSWAIFSKMRFLVPDSKKIFTAKVLLAASLGLSLEVKERLTETFNNDFQPALEADDYGSILASLLDSGYEREVLQILELAQTRYPNHASLHVLRGITFDALGEPRLAAQSLAQAASLDPKFAHDAALLLSRVDEMELALTYNSLVNDRVKKLEQRAILYLQQRDFERLTGLEKSLASAGLLQRDDLRYAMAFSHYQGGRFNIAQSLLAGITDSRIFDKATVLRAEIAKRCKTVLVVDCG